MNKLSAIDFNKHSKEGKDPVLTKQSNSDINSNDIVMGEVTEHKEMLKLTAKKMGVEYVDLENTCVNKNAILAIEARIAQKYTVFPFEIRNNLLYVAMQSPDEIFLIDEIKFFTKMELKPFLADRRLIEAAINFYYKMEESDEEVNLLTEELINEVDIEDILAAHKVSENNINMDNLIESIIKKHLKYDNITTIQISLQG